MIDKFIFYPERLEKDYAYSLGPGDRELFIRTSDGESVNGLLFRSPGSRGIVLYFHGNAGSLGSWQYVSPDITSKHYDLLIIDYRGYGKSSGKISEKGFYLDAEASYEELKKLGYSDRQIVLYGRSLGTGVAVELALGKNARGLILEAPFTNLPDLASCLFPIFLPALYIPYKFDNVGKAASIRMPTLILHGDADELIPTGQSKRVFEALSGKKERVLIKDGGHNTLSEFPQYHKALEDFLAML
jgi:pimeloyl-ACP methyl ester carboxylesterase